MKTKILFLLLALGATLSTSAQTAEIKREAFLSRDKSNITIVTTKNKALLKDTVIYFVIDDAQKLINDSIALKFTKNDFVILSDSIYPRWTHLIGKEKVVERKLIRRGSAIILVFGKRSKIPAKDKNIFLCILIFSAFISLVSFLTRKYKEYTRNVLLVIFILFIVLIILNFQGSFWNSIFVATLTTVPALLISYIPRKHHYYK